MALVSKHLPSQWPLLLCVGIQYGCIYQDGKEKNNTLCSFVPRDATAVPCWDMGACLLNKRREQRQNAVRMRVKRLQEMIEGEYACHLSGVMRYSDQRECMNIIRIYEQRIRELLEFYDFRDMSNEINLLLFLCLLI